MKIIKLITNITLGGVMDLTATVTSFLLPLLLIAAVWVGWDLMANYIYTDAILLIASVVFYKALNLSTNDQ